MKMPFRSAARAVALAAALAASAAHGHDTWFAPLPGDTPGSVALALGTGNQFPVHESGIDVKHLLFSGCRGEVPGSLMALQRTADAPTALNLRVRADRQQALTCWAQTASFEVMLPDDKIALYFKEIQAPASVRETWAAMRARGIAWKERYTKHARIELNPGVNATRPVNMAMDAVLEAPQHTPRRGDALQFRVLRNGHPLPDFAVELRGNQLPIGLWRKTDAEGRVHFAAPLAGRWVLRGTELRLSETEPDVWESRFVTLAFEIENDPSGRPQAGNKASPKARSTNQTAATPAINTEPPAITVRR